MAHVCQEGRFETVGFFGFFAFADFLSHLPVEAKSHDEDNDQGTEKGYDTNDSQPVPFVEIRGTLIIDCIAGIEIAVGIMQFQMPVIQVGLWFASGVGRNIACRGTIYNLL